MTKKEDDGSIKISKNMMLSISILLSTLILSATIFMVGGTISNSLSNFTVAGNLQATGSGGGSGSGTLAPTPLAPAPSPTPTAPRPSGGTVSLADTSKDPAGILGSDDAPIVIVEYSDYQCPFCRSWFDNSKSQLEQEYIETGKVQFIYKDFPLSFHPMANTYAQAARCAGEQEKYFEFHDKIFIEQGKFGNGTVSNITKEDIKQWAADLGLNTTEFNTCLDSGKYNEIIQSNFTDGSAAGVSGTPSFLVGTRGGNGQLMVGAQPYATLKSTIDSLLS